MGKSKTFYKASLYLDEFKVSAGINLLNHYRSLIAFVKKMTSTNFESPDSPPFEIVRNTASQQRQPSKTSLSKTEGGISWWDKQRMTMHGNLNITLVGINLDILTHTSPFSEECLRLSMGMANFRYKTKEFEILLKDISVLRLEELGQLRNGTERLGMKEGETAILLVPQVEVLANLDWNPEIDDHYCIIRHILPNVAGSTNINDEPRLDRFLSKQLSLKINVNIPKKEKIDDQEVHNLFYEEGELGQLVYNSPVPVLHYQTRLFATLLSLPQLSHDFLMLNGIRLVSYKAIDDAAATENMMDKKSSTAAQNGQSESAPEQQKSNNASNSQLFEKFTPTAAGTKEIMEQITKRLAEYEFSEEFTNYLDLLTFSLNEQLNVKGKPNIIGWISEVDFRVNVTKMRVLMTNVHQKHSVELRSGLTGGKKSSNLTAQKTSGEKSKDKSEQYNLCGVQSVINSIMFKSTFYKKEVS